MQAVDPVLKLPVPGSGFFSPGRHSNNDLAHQRRKVAGVACGYAALRIPRASCFTIPLSLYEKRFAGGLSHGALSTLQAPILRHLILHLALIDVYSKRFRSLINENLWGSDESLYRWSIL
jgi:hypothetical protein